jgi:hypothetical protein
MALVAFFRVDRDKVVDLVGGERLSVRGRVTGLPARFTSRRRVWHSRWRSVRRIRTGRAGGVGRVSVQSMLQRPNPRIQSLDDLFQRPVLGPQTLVLSFELRVLGFEFLNPAFQPCDVCLHPFLLEVEHASVKKDSSEMWADLLRPSRLSGSLGQVDAYIS